MFKYIAPIDIKINIPQSIIDWANDYDYLKNPVINKYISRQVDRLIHRYNPEDDQFPMELKYGNQCVTLTLESYNEIKKIKLASIKHFGLSKLPSYNRIPLPTPFKEELISSLPNLLQQSNPTPVLQIIDGEGMLAHSDFGRKSSLFFLLTDQPCDTMWYESNGKVNLHEYAYKHGFFYSIANIEHIELAKTSSLKKHQWYVFDNRTYHSIKSKNGRIVRRCLQIEFSNMSAEDLYVSLM
jgi:hypothetical protein